MGPPLVPPPAVRLDRLVMAGLSLYAVLVAMRLASAAGVEGLIWDDGYYYLQIARNLARGAGPSVDGLHATNGFHPLWLLALLPIFRLTPDAGAALAAVIGVQACLLSVAAVLLYHLARELAGRTISVAAVLLWIHLTHRLMLSGLEYGLHVTLLLASTAVYLRRPGGPGSWMPADLALGAVLALLFLSRLESILFAGIVAALAAWPAATGRRAPVLPRAAALAGPAIVVAALYAAANAWWANSPTPVSAAVKRAWSQLALEADPVYQQAGWLVAKATHLAWPLGEPPGLWPITLVAGTWAVGVCWLARRRLRLERLNPFAPLIAYSVVTFVLYALLYHGRWSGTPWYYAAAPVLAVLLLAAVLGALERADTRARAAIAITLALAMALATPARTMREIGRASLAGAAWIGPALQAIAQLPREAILASWNGGTLTFRSDRRIVNLDGLTNTWVYFHEQRRDLCAYWRETGVTHVVDFFDFTATPPAAPLLAVYRPLYDFSACRDRLTLVWADESQPASARVAVFALERPGAPGSP